MGVVYAAYDESLDRCVALELLLSEAQADFKPDNVMIQRSGGIGGRSPLRVKVPHGGQLTSTVRNEDIQTINTMDHFITP